jgi:hypothetical protein
MMIVAWNGAGPTGVALAKAAASRGLTVATAAELAALPDEPALSDDLAPIERLSAPLRAARLETLARQMGFR